MAPTAPATTTAAARAWRVGAMTLCASTSARDLVEPMRRAGGGYEAARGGDVAARLRVDVAFDLDGAPTPVARAPRWLPCPSGEPGSFVDGSEGWNARMTGLTADSEAVTVDAHLRPLIEDPDHLRAIIEGSLRVVAATAAPRCEAILIHGAALISPDGERGVAFVGRSGAGKTTMTRRLPGWRVLADDTAWIGREGGHFVVRGTPFRGREGLARSGDGVRLDRVVILAPGAPALGLRHVAPAEAFFALSQRLMWFTSGPWTEAAMDVLAALVEAVPTQRLASSLDHDVAPLFDRSRLDMARGMAASDHTLTKEISC